MHTMKAKKERIREDDDWFWTARTFLDDSGVQKGIVLMATCRDFLEDRYEINKFCLSNEQKESWVVPVEQWWLENGGQRSNLDGGYCVDVTNFETQDAKTKAIEYLRNIAEKRGLCKSNFVRQ